MIIKKESFIYWTTAVILLIFLGFQLSLSINLKKSQKFYTQGLEFIEKKDYQNAYYNFRKIPFNSSLSTLAVYKQAWCSKELNDRKTAIRKYKRYVQLAKDETTAPVGWWELGLLYLEEENYKEALWAFKKLLKDYPNSDYGKAANYQVGSLLAAQNASLANEYFIEYLKYAPVGRYAKESISYVENSLTILSNEQKYYLAIALYENKLYSKSVTYLKDIPFSMGWYYLAKNYEATGSFTARSTYLDGLRQTGANEDVKHITDALDSFVKLTGGEKKEAWRTLVYSLRDTKNSAYPGALFNFSQFLSRTDALVNYEKIYTDYPKSHWASESLWEVFWIKYKARDFKTALKLANEHIGEYENTNASPKILFWCAKILEKQNKRHEADKLYKRMLEKYPDSYYAFRANEQLNRNRRPFKTIKDRKVRANTTDAKFPYRDGNKTMQYLNRLADLGDSQTIEDFKINDEFIKSWLMVKNGNLSQAMLVAREAMNSLEEKPNLKDPRWRLVYPIYYSREINFAAERNSVSPYLTLGIMREESYFNTNATSYVGALGLMQLMPDTAKYVAGKSYDPLKLKDPGYNIFLGTRYFAIALSELNGNEMLAVLGYNSGPGSVKKWVQSVEHNDPDEFIEDVPYFETRNYVKKIYASYWNYLRIYEY